MKELDLEDYAGRTEKTWKDNYFKICRKFIKKINKKIKIDLYKKANNNNPVDLVSFYQVWLLDNYKDALESTLKEMKIDFKKFYLKFIYNFIITIARENDNAFFIKDALKRSGVINEVYVNDSKMFTIKSNYLNYDIRFRKISDSLVDKEILDFINKPDIKSGCHEAGLFMIEKDPNYTSITSMSKFLLGGKYYHSFVIDESQNVFDLTANLIMQKELYYELNEVDVISTINGNEYKKTIEEVNNFDKKDKLMPILKIAAYRQFNKNR